MIKNITNYYEAKDFLVCSFEILEVEENDITDIVEEIKKLISEKWIDWHVVVKQNIKFKLWIRNKREFKKAKANLIGILKDSGFKWGNETIFGDGTPTQNGHNR